MELKKIIEKIGKDKFRAAMQADDRAALDALLDDAGVTLTDEQLDYIAGGFAGFAGDNDLSCHPAEPDSICA